LKPQMNTDSGGPKAQNIPAQGEALG